MSELDSETAAGLRRVVEPIETAKTLPPAVYRDAAVFDLEQRRMFRSGWVGLGRADRWRATGDYTTVTIADVPIVVVRGDEGTLRGFDNTCSHRANPVMKGEGNCVRMQCDFHAWTYRLDGSVHAAPSMQQTPGFDRADYGLHEFSIAERFGFAFVSLDHDPPDIDEWLTDFETMHLSWSLDRLVTGRRREFHLDANWKPFMEVFNEYYHLPYVHPDSINATYLEPDAVDDVKGSFTTQFGLTDGTGALLDGMKDSVLPVMPGLVGRDRDGVRYTWIYPNMTFAAGSEAVWMYEVYPVSPGRTLCAQTVCFPPETIASDGFEAKAASYYERFDVAIDEDIPFLQRQFHGQRSPFARQGRFSHLEPSVAKFACWYADRLLADD